MATKPKDNTKAEPKKRGRPPKPKTKEPAKPKKEPKRASSEKTEKKQRGNPAWGVNDIPYEAKRRRPDKYGIAPPTRRGESVPTILDVDRKFMTDCDGSLEMTTTATDEEVSQIVHFNYRWFRAPIVKSDDDCEQRMEAFFNEVEQTGEIPTMEKLALALGVTRRTLNIWKQGASVSPRRKWLVERAEETMAAVDAELAIHGKLPQVLYIFRSKNYYGLHDETKVTIEPANPLGDLTDRDELAKRYAEDIIEVDDTDT